MRIVLCSINARYIHTNLALRTLKGYLTSRSPEHKYLLTEWHGKENILSMVRSLHELRPDMVFFSVYLWNRENTVHMTKALKKLLPNVVLVLGGPEVSYAANSLMQEHPEIDCIIKGEGEGTAHDLIRNGPHGVPGLYYREQDRIVFGGERPFIEDLDSIPFPYTESDMSGLTDRIVYYETSRGCPFSCAYCTSSISPGVRTFGLERVKNDIKFFLVHNVPLVKFVDRTFNADPARALAIWRYIMETHNGRTCFHFEIAGDLLTDETLELLSAAPKNMFQFEVGIQSTNSRTLEKIRRRTDIGRLVRVLKRLNRNIPVHIDLIAGLPEEDLDTFAASFDTAIGLFPNVLQLGFLKVLPGTAMETIAQQAGYLRLDVPPYEVFQTPAMSFSDLSLLKDIAELVEIFYNSGAFASSLTYMLSRTSAFAFFKELASYYREHGYFTAPHTRDDHFAFLHGFVREDGTATELLRYDFMLLGKHGHFPDWYERRYSKEMHVQALNAHADFASGREAFGRSDLDTFLIEPATRTAGAVTILFLYAGDVTKAIML